MIFKKLLIIFGLMLFASAAFGSNMTFNPISATDLLFITELPFTRLVEFTVAANKSNGFNTSANFSYANESTTGTLGPFSTQDIQDFFNDSTPLTSADVDVDTDFTHNFTLTFADAIVGFNMSFAVGHQSWSVGDNVVQFVDINISAKNRFSGLFELVQEVTLDVRDITGICTVSDFLIGSEYIDLNGLANLSIHLSTIDEDNTLGQSGTSSEDCEGESFTMDDLTWPYVRIFPIFGEGNITAISPTNFTTNITSTGRIINETAYWPFDSGNANATVAQDISGNNFDGNVTEAIFNSTGDRDGTGAYEFDGVNDIITAPDIDLGLRFFFSAWVFPTSTTVGMKVIASSNGFGNGWFLEIRADNVVRCAVGGVFNATDSSVTINDSEWAFVGCLGNGTHLQPVINNQFSGVVAYSTVDDSLTNVWIAAQNAFDFFNGSIDDPRIYNRSLTLGEISSVRDKDISILTDSASRTNSTQSTFDLEPGVTGWMNYTITYQGIKSVFDQIFNFTATSNPTVGQFQQTLTVLAFNNTSQTFQDPVFESNFTNITLTINVSANVTNVTGNLIWNGSTETANSTDNGDNTWTLSRFFQVPLVTVNNSSVNFNWIYNITYSNDEQQNNSTADASQNINQAYIPVLTVPSTGLEGGEFIVTANVTKLIDQANLSSNVLFNGTTTNMTNVENVTQADFNVTLTPIQITVDNITFVVNYTLTMSIPGQTIDRTLNDTITIFMINLTNCSGILNEDERFTINVFDEDTLAQLNTTMTAVATINTTNVTRNVSFQFASNQTHHICMIPNVSQFTAVINLTYTAPGFSQREHFIDTLLIAGTSPTLLNLFLANTTDTDLWTIIIKDQGNEVEGATVKVLRFFPVNNTNILVGTGVTNSQGRVQFNLFSTEVKYQFIVEIGGETVLITNTAPLTALASEDKVIELDINTNPIPITVTYKDIQVSCSITTDNTSCTVNDVSGLMSRFDLTVNFINAMNGTTRLCDSSATTTAATLTCTNHSLFNGTGTFSFILTGTDTENTIILETGSASRKDDPFGGIGDLMAPFFILFSVLAGLSITKDAPEGIIIGTMVGIGGIATFNLTNNTNPGAIIIISALILIQISRTRR